MQFTHKKTVPLYIPTRVPFCLNSPCSTREALQYGRSAAISQLPLALLPEVVETIEEASGTRLDPYQEGFKTEIDKHIYLHSIKDTNETLFYH